MSPADPHTPAEEAVRRQRSDQRRSLEESRTRGFLWTQTALLAIGAVLSVSTALTGTTTQLVLIQTLVFSSLFGVLTALGWFLFLRRKATTSVVIGLLYVDSIVALFLLYVAGEFEVAIGLLWFAIIMAPIYAHKKHAWGLAFFQIGVYLVLMTTRQMQLLPYGQLLPYEAVTQWPFVIDSVSAFIGITLGMAYLAGQASMDIVSSQQQLEEAVDEQTRLLADANAELAAASRALKRSNRALSERNEQLADTNTDLQSSNAALDQFNAAVSHDLRSPLQTVTGAVELLTVTEPEISRRGHERLRQLADATDRMARMIRELRHLSQVGEAPKFEPLVSLDDCVDEARRDLEMRIKNASARVEIDGPLPSARGSAGLLKQVFQNLLENAIKYGAPGGPKVRVVPAPARDRRVAVAVEDDGEGIEPAEMPAVFQMFRRLDRHAGTDGIGAGLAIVQRIVLAHRGSIAVERSETLGGARFVVELPAPGESSAEIVAPSLDD